MASENPQAFPHVKTMQGRTIEYAEGMTLRDYFAGQAMIAIPHVGCGADLESDDFAKASYQFADAMLGARSQTHD